jgi:hypothetical protein
MKKEVILKEEDIIKAYDQSCEDGKKILKTMCPQVFLDGKKDYDPKKFYLKVDNYGEVELRYKDEQIITDSHGKMKEVNK